MAVFQAEVDSERDAQILSILRQAKRLSRADLARRTGLSRSVLEARLTALKRHGLLTEAGPGASTGGRRPQLVVFGKDAGYVVAVALGRTSVDVAVTDLSAAIRARCSQALDVRDGPTQGLALIDRLIEQVLAEAGIAHEQVRGIGIGFPGLVELRTGPAESLANIAGWHHVPLREHFEEVFGWRAFLDNDANVMALGERWAGLGRTVDDFLFIKMGSGGVGCGIICGGRIYRGADGCAGHIGHFAVPGEDAACSCGNSGCLGAVVGGYAVARRMEQAARAGESTYLGAVLAQKGALTAADLGEALGHADPYAAREVRRIGSCVGQVLAGLVNFYNPGLIVIGGGLANLGDLLVATIREAIYGRSTPLATRHLAIERSPLGDTVGVVGAAALVLDELFRAPHSLSSGLPQAR